MNSNAAIDRHLARAKFYAGLTALRLEQSQRRLAALQIRLGAASAAKPVR